MEQYPSPTMHTQPSIEPLKDSIRDMIRLQRDYQVPDELFWEIFNVRVLLNEQIDVNAFVGDLNRPAAQA